ncbi:MAG: cupin domain-containing protein [Steroidobacter sp.]
MEHLSPNDFKLLTNPGVASLQLLSPHNSQSTQVTITRVTVEAGAVQERHQHESSEQILLALSGNGTLLFSDEKTSSFSEGELVRFAKGEIHGFHNTGNKPFVYISVTSPPVDFSNAYQHKA